MNRFFILLLMTSLLIASTTLAVENNINNKNIDSDKDGITDYEEVNKSSCKNSNANGLIHILTISEDGVIKPLWCKDLDTDGDGTPDRLDLDSDDDGIADSEEIDKSSCVDKEYKDKVKVNVTVKVCEDLDRDGDGVPNRLDLDSDDDGLYDVMETKRGVDQDHEGRYGTKNEKIDNNNNGMDDRVEEDKKLILIDSDGDGIPNFQDNDDDDDDILTKHEHPDDNENGDPDDARDMDGDKKPDYLDNDFDNDGIPDKADLDDDDDGITDYEEIDKISCKKKNSKDHIVKILKISKTGNNIEEWYCKDLDTDSDGIPDRLDLDSDGDGLYDVIETKGGVDQDQDGKYDEKKVDNNDNGMDDRVEDGVIYGKDNVDNKLIGKKLILIDSDGNGIPDFQDGEKYTTGGTFISCNYSNDSSMIYIFLFLMLFMLFKNLSKEN